MQFLGILNVLLAVTLVTAFQSPHGKAPKYVKREIKPQLTHEAPLARSASKFLSSKTKKFAVDGNAIPEVDFNIGESYAGTLPITANASDTNRLWFWFFPSENPAASKEITIWLNGGPGCSSLDGLFQEHGPFLWQPGTYKPVKNPYAWTNLTNMIYIDQPVGVGYSPGIPDIYDEIDVARDFMGFWKNFIETFCMEGYKVYITGESYAGQYIPYIASEMLDKNDVQYYNVKGIQINDPSINYDDTMIYSTVVPALHYFNNLLGLNDSFLGQIQANADACGFTNFVNKYSSQFPPRGKIPTAPDSSRPGCSTYDDVLQAVYNVNPCFNIYHLTDFCPYLWDELGFPSLGIGPNNYFNRSDVQAALNVGRTVDYSICGNDPFHNQTDLSPPSSLGPLPSVIERTNNVLIGHGFLDFLLFVNGSIISIQNMTWNGAQGFQNALPRHDNFYVPYHPGLLEVFLQVDDGTGTAGPGFSDVAGAGLAGKTHTERGLTFCTVNLAGHQIPQYTPGAAYRQLEFLLGRIPSLETVGDFTTLPGNFTGALAFER